MKTKYLSPINLLLPTYLLVFIKLYNIHIRPKLLPSIPLSIVLDYTINQIRVFFFSIQTFHMTKRGRVFIPIIPTNGINQIKKEKLKEKS